MPSAENGLYKTSQSTAIHKAADQQIQSQDINFQSEKKGAPRGEIAPLSPSPQIKSSMKINGRHQSHVGTSLPQAQWGYSTFASPQAFIREYNNTANLDQPVFRKPSHQATVKNEFFRNTKSVVSAKYSLATLGSLGSLDSYRGSCRGSNEIINQVHTLQPSLKFRAKVIEADKKQERMKMKQRIEKLEQDQVRALKTLRTTLDTLDKADEIQRRKQEDQDNKNKWLNFQNQTLYNLHESNMRAREQNKASIKKGRDQVLCNNIMNRELKKQHFDHLSAQFQKDTMI